MEKENNNAKKEDDPCWKGYHQLGIKTKDGEKVPNCVPEKKAKNKKSE